MLIAPDRQHSLSYLIHVLYPEPVILTLSNIEAKNPGEAHWPHPLTSGAAHLKSGVLVKAADIPSDHQAPGMTALGLSVTLARRRHAGQYSNRDGRHSTPRPSDHRLCGRCLMQWERDREGTPEPRFGCNIDAPAVGLRNAPGDIKA